MGNDRLYECLDCGTVYAERIPDAAALLHTYNQLYAAGGNYQSHRSEVELIRAAKQNGHFLKVGWERREFFKRTSSKGGEPLLDVGCGTGYFLWAAKQRGWDSQGIELSTEAAQLGMPVHGLRVENIRIEDFAPSVEFSAVTAWEVLEHLPKPKEFFSRVLEILPKGGIFAGSIPNYGRPRYRFGNDLGISSVPPVHLNFWTPQSFSTILKKAGFRNVDIVIPRVCTDLLRPIRRFRPARLRRFAAVACGFDVPTTMFFIAHK